MPAKAKAPAAKSTGLHAVIGSDEGMVREEALKLYNQLTGGSDDGFTHEVIDGIADFLLSAITDGVNEFND